MIKFLVNREVQVLDFCIEKLLLHIFIFKMHAHGQSFPSNLLQDVAVRLFQTKIYSLSMFDVSITY